MLEPKPKDQPGDGARQAPKPADKSRDKPAKKK